MLKLSKNELCFSIVSVSLTTILLISSTLFVFILDYYVNFKLTVIIKSIVSFVSIVSIWYILGYLLSKLFFIRNIYSNLIKYYLNTVIYDHEDYKTLKEIAKIRKDITHLIWGPFFYIYEIRRGENIFTLFSLEKITKKNLNHNNIYRYNKLIIFHI